MPLHTDETIRRELRMRTEAIEAAGVDGAGAGQAADATALRRRRPARCALKEEATDSWSVTL
jgi:hypothetical protein